MDLLEYPRPRNDNGRGVHWFPTLGQRRSVVDENVARLADLKIKWLVFWNGLDDAALLVNDYLVKRLVAAGIVPVMHVYLRPIAPFDDAALTRLHRLVAFYRDPQRRIDYFQLFYEPNVAGEWADDKLPADVPARLLDAWLPAAQEVVNAGGLPGLAPLWPGGDYDDMRFLEETLQGIADRGHSALLDKAWIALHNYNLGHGLGDPEDPNGFHRFAWVDRVVRERVGRPLPLLTTEGGTRAGPPPYGDGADDQQVSADTISAYDLIKSAPDNYFCYCPWLFGNLIGGGDDAGWEPMAWFTAEGERPVVAAVRALEDVVRVRGAAEAPPPGARERLVEETGHWVRGPFFEFFARHGVDLCGFPLGEAEVENGLPTQYFQKVVLEEYWPGRIRLRPAGAELVDLHVQVAQTQGQIEPLQREIEELQERLRVGMVLQPNQPPAEAAGAQAPRPMTTEAAALAERLAAAEFEVKRLRERNVRLEAMLEAPQPGGDSGELAAVAAGEMYKLQNKVEDLKAELELTVTRADKAAVERVEAVARLDELQGRIVNGDAYALASREALEVAELVKDLEVKLAAAEEQIHLQSERQAADEEHVRQLEIEKVRTNGQLEAAAEQAAALQERLAAAESQASLALGQVQKLEADKTSLAAKIADLTARLQKAEEAPPGLTVHQLKDRIAQLEAALMDSQTAVQSMMSDKPMISQVMDKWKSAQQALGGAAETARLQGQVSALEQSVADARMQSSELREALAAAQGKVRELRQAAGAKAAPAEERAPREPSDRELLAKVAEMESFVSKVQAEMRRLQEENKQLSGHVAEMEAAGRRKK